MLFEANELCDGLLTARTEVSKDTGISSFLPSLTHPFIFFLSFFLGPTARLGGSEFSDQELNLVQGSESTESQPLDHCGFSPSIFILPLLPAQLESLDDAK